MAKGEEGLPKKGRQKSGGKHGPARRGELNGVDSELQGVLKGGQSPEERSTASPEEEEFDPEKAVEGVEKLWDGIRAGWESRGVNFLDPAVQKHLGPLVEQMNAIRQMAEGHKAAGNQQEKKVIEDTLRRMIIGFGGKVRKEVESDLGLSTKEATSAPSKEEKEEMASNAGQQAALIRALMGSEELSKGGKLSRSEIPPEQLARFTESFTNPKKRASMMRNALSYIEFLKGDEKKEEYSKQLELLATQYPIKEEQTPELVQLPPHIAAPEAVAVSEAERQAAHKARLFPVPVTEPVPAQKQSLPSFRDVERSIDEKILDTKVANQAEVEHLTNVFRPRGEELRETAAAEGKEVAAVPSSGEPSEPEIGAITIEPPTTAEQAEAAAAEEAKKRAETAAQAAAQPATSEPAPVATAPEGRPLESLAEKIGRVQNILWSLPEDANEERWERMTEYGMGLFRAALITCDYPDLDEKRFNAQPKDVPYLTGLAQWLREEFSRKLYPEHLQEEYARRRNEAKEILKGENFGNEFWRGPDGTGVSPIAEAEVYAAYGRYQQALEILDEGIRKFRDKYATGIEKEGEVTGVESLTASPELEGEPQAGISYEDLMKALGGAAEPKGSEKPTAAESRSALQKLIDKYNEIRAAAGESVRTMGERGRALMEHLGNRAAELGAQAGELFTRKESVPETIPVAAAPAAAAESAESSSKFQKSKMYLVGRLDALGVGKKFENLGEWYNKRHWAWKLTAGAALTLGMGLSLPYTASALGAGIFWASLSGTLAQRAIGLAGTYKQFENALSNVHEGKTAGKFYDTRLTRWLASGSDESRKRLAMTGAVALQFGLSYAIGYTANKIGEWYGEYLKNKEYSAPAEVPTASATAPEAAQATVGEAAPTPATEATVPDAAQERTLESIQTPPKPPEVSASAAPAALSEVSVEARAGKGYEWMAKQLWRQLQEQVQKEGADPEQYSGDMRKLVEADASNIDEVVHEIAKENKFFNLDTGGSRQINLGDTLSFDKETGKLLITSAEGKSFVDAPSTLPLTEPYPPEAPTYGAPIAPEDYSSPASSDLPQETIPPPERIQPVDLTGEEQSSTTTPEAPPVETPTAPSSAEAPSTGAAPPLRELVPEYTREFVNAHQLKINPLEGHVFQDNTGAVFAYGNDFKARFDAAQEYAKAHRGTSVWVQAEKPFFYQGAWRPWVHEVKATLWSGFKVLNATEPANPSQVGPVLPDAFIKQLK